MDFVQRMGVSEPLIQTSLLGEAIEHAPVAVFVADEQGRFVAVNQAACVLVGYDRGELLQLAVTDISAGGVVGENGSAGRPVGVRTSTINRKDGTTVQFTHATAATTIAGMPVSVCVGAES
ncbi:MAG: PAS domain S-box protein [Gaiellaceae bacterium]